jgi:hypothetical protein
MAWQLTPTVRRVFVPTKELRRNGEPKRRPVTHRTLTVESEPAGALPCAYRVYVMRRGGSLRFSVSCRPQLAQGGNRCTEPTYTQAESYRKFATFEPGECARWLSWFVGGREQAERTLAELLASAPTA